MIEIADIFQLYAPQYLKLYGDKILPSHRKVMEKLCLCRTEPLGGQLWLCEPCDQFHYSYHSCKNRHCPKCQNDDATLWLDKQTEKLLPTHYFMVTFTLPGELREVARSNQKTVYSLFFQTSAQALQKLADDPKYVGGLLGMIGVLHTWARDLSYHLNLHYLIPGGGLTPDGKKWRKTKIDFLLHWKPLAIIFKAKIRDAFKKAGLINQVDPKVWKKEWRIDIEPVGNGLTVLKYLAPYIFRVALSNRNILKLENDQVTYRFKDSKTNQFTTRTLPALQFIHQFLQHVLPKGFVKVRYYGFLASKRKHLMAIVKELLGKILIPKPKTKPAFKFRCPTCGQAMLLLGEISRKRGPPLLYQAG
jgi:hypothetical protein